MLLSYNTINPAAVFPKEYFYNKNKSLYHCLDHFEQHFEYVQVQLKSLSRISNGCKIIYSKEKPLAICEFHLPSILRF